MPPRVWCMGCGSMAMCLHFSKICIGTTKTKHNKYPMYRPPPIATLHFIIQPQPSLHSKPTPSSHSHSTPTPIPILTILSYPSLPTPPSHPQTNSPTLTIPLKLPPTDFANPSPPSQSLSPNQPLKTSKMALPLPYI